MLFTGDHVMQGSTVVINPPDGVMAEYLVVQQQAAGPASAEALLPLVYEDVHPARHGVALRSLQAHLLHLQGRGLAQECQGVWALLKPQ